jgi:hypothetical protein
VNPVCQSENGARNHFVRFLLQLETVCCIFATKCNGVMAGKFSNPIDVLGIIADRQQ